MRTFSFPLVLAVTGAFAPPGICDAPVTRKPYHFGVVVFPTFQSLDVFGPIDAFNLLSLRESMNLSIIAKTLDPVSTRPVAMNPANSTFGESIVPTHTFDNPPANLDVLLIPGGGGTRAPGLEPLVAYINATYPSLQYLLTTCTGAWLAARAGVLDGRNATTNKLAWKDRVRFGSDKVNWIPKARWVVDGNIWSSSGVSAGIDSAMAWIQHVYGNDTATWVANGLEYDRHMDPSWDPFSDIYNLTGNLPPTSTLPSFSFTPTSSP